jgi:hypothetical protein
MQIFTSCWFHYRGPGRIGISRGAPRGGDGGYRMYRALAPTRDILQRAKDQSVYRRRFFAEVLDKLDPQKVLSDLEDRSEEGRAVLLCFEKPPLHAGNWCHRTMVAEWITRETGVPVEEWSGVKETNPQQQTLDV